MSDTEPIAVESPPTSLAVDERGASLAAAERRLDDVEAALERLEQGSYGRCGSCGSPIADRTLDADPLATTCDSCQSAFAGSRRSGAESGRERGK
ncbi:MAG: TraR/DksA family transcriptional regulator [Acidimicrobiales bacterium]